MNKNLPNRFFTIQALVAVVLMAASAVNLNAQLIAYDGFNYTPNDPIGGLNGGTGWAGAWVGNSAQFNHIVTSTTLSYGTLQTSGNSVFLAGPRSPEEVQRTFSNAPTTGSVFISWINDATNAGTFNQLRLQNGGSRFATVGRHNTAAGSNWEIYDGNFNNPVTSSVAMTGIQLAVLELNLTTFAINLYVNPSSLGGAAPGTATATANYGSSVFTDTLRFVQDAAGAGPGFDEVRVGNSFADVTPIPEPSTYAMILVGLGAVLLFRRRRVS